MLFRTSKTIHKPTLREIIETNVRADGDSDTAGDQRKRNKEKLRWFSKRARSDKGGIEIV